MQRKVPELCECQEVFQVRAATAVFVSARRYEWVIHADLGVEQRGGQCKKNKIKTQRKRVVLYVWNEKQNARGKEVTAAPMGCVW